MKHMKKNHIQLFFADIKKDAKEMLSEWRRTLLCAQILFFTNSMRVFASEQITSGINSLTDLVFSIIAGIGAVFLGLGIFDFAASLSSHDSSQQKQGLARIASGLLMIFVKVLVSLLRGQGGQ